MDKTTITRTALAGGVAGLGLAVGGITIAMADDSGTSTYAAGVDAGVGMHGKLAGRDGDAAARLAEKLGVSEQEVTDAFAAVRDQLEPERADRVEGERPEPLTEAEREARQAETAAALAEELGVEASAVTDALAELRAEAGAAVRTSLSDRLDAAVEAGDLTAADKASVLKAFDAGVLGGGSEGRGGFGHGRHGR